MEKTQLDTEDEKGNTKPFRARGWVLTQNSYDETQLNEYLEEATRKCKWYIIGKEVAPTTGMKHLQVYLYYDNDRTFVEMKNKFKTAHIEKAKGTPKHNAVYCSKEKDFITNMDIPKAKKPIKTINENQLYDWQKKLEALHNTEPDDRTIYWVWEPTGKTGKSSFTKYMKVKYGDEVCILNSPKSADILTCANEEYKTYIFDFSRSQEGYEPWNALEQLKNGMITDAKLKKKARQLIFNSPHVICFSNFEPEQHKLSNDRWKIIRIRNNLFEDRVGLINLFK